MNEVMVGELSEFAEGGYRVLRVDTSSSASSGRATASSPTKIIVRTTAVRCARAR